jgi:hypothetical protein
MVVKELALHAGGFGRADGELIAGIRVPVQGKVAVNKLDVLWESI